MGPGRPAVRRPHRHAVPGPGPWRGPAASGCGRGGRRPRRRRPDHRRLARMDRDSDTPPAAVVVSWRSAAMLVDTREIGSFPDLPTSCPTANSAGPLGWILRQPSRHRPPIPARGSRPWRPTRPCASRSRGRAPRRGRPMRPAATLPGVPGAGHRLRARRLPGGLRAAGGGGSWCRWNAIAWTPCRYASTDAARTKTVGATMGGSTWPTPSRGVAP